MKTRFAIATLAQFVHRRGDIHGRLEGRARAEEGIRVQRKLQNGKAVGYERERPVTLEREIAGRCCTIGGRIDGCDARAHLIEEYKTTRADANLAHAHHASAHWAQIQLYAALLSEELGSDARTVWTLRLVYCHPDTLATTAFERTLCSGELARFLDDTLKWLGAWLERQQAHERARDQALAELAFPHAEFRPHQRALARRAYRALRDREHLLLEAPTGSGKTIGLLYPAAKALATTDHEKIFYLTSRSTGARAAVAGCDQLDPDHRYLRYVQIVSKEQVCLVEGMPCDPQRCPYARGYYDRVHEAVGDLLGRRAMTPAEVRAVAERHVVCPFELSLDAAVWADVLIGDYNYVFDPLVNLQRFAADPGIALLVDESHQLSSRACEMLSLGLSRGLVRATLREPLPKGLLRRVRAIDRNLRGMRSSDMADGEHLVAKPDALLRAIGRLVEELAAGDIALEAYPRMRELVMTCARWARAEAWYDAERCVHVLKLADGELTIRRLHLDPGPYLQQRFEGFGGHIRFSGTVSPLSLYQKLHGVNAGAGERAGSPFAPEQLEVLIVDDVATYWRARERSLEAVVEVIAGVTSARRGNYLVALPSFAYLESVAGVLQARFSCWNLAVQSPAMSASQRAAFLARLQDASARTVGLVVMGGVFGESVDFAVDDGCPGSAIAGVVCIGAGLPPPTMERRQVSAYFSARGDDGHAVAFQQPAMTKIVQMAGRLLRDPGDRGVLCLVDPRFKDPAYQRFFPGHWRPRVVGARQVARRLNEFWQAVPGSPERPVS